MTSRKEAEVKYGNLLDSIIEVDPYMRSVIIADLNGDIIEKRLVQGTRDFLTEEQNKQVMEYTINYWNYRKTMADKIGNAKFILESYENFKKLVIALSAERLLIVTFEKEGGQKDIVERIQSVIELNETYDACRSISASH